MTSSVRITRPDQVCEVLRDPRFLVPAADADGSAPATMGWLRQTVARFCNGPDHDRHRALVRTHIARLDPARLRAAACAYTLAGHAPRTVPVVAVGSELGVPEREFGVLVPAVVAVAGAYQPGASAARTARADAGVKELTALLGPDEPEALANRIGLLVQTCDATGNLIDHAIKAAQGPDGPVVAAADPGAVEELVTATLSADPPVRSTVRVAASGAELGGRPVPEGTVMVLDLAAADRTFGHGIRPCPGSEQARALACGVLEALVQLRR